MKNQVQLICYADRLTGGGLAELQTMLNGVLSGLFGAVHILPFFYPIDGSDAGFDPIDHQTVDARLGQWQHINALSCDIAVMADLIVNHMSAQSRQFRDVLQHGPHSAYWPLFLKERDVFPSGITVAQQQHIARPRPISSFTPYTLADGTIVPFWTTFTANQIDINVQSVQGQQYLHSILTTFAQHGVSIVRLDAAGFTIKQADSRCFMLEQTYDFINQLTEQAHQLGMTTVAEVHGHYLTQIATAKRVDRVYDFALPPLVLHCLLAHDPAPLAQWLTIAPHNCLTVLDTHDGIGLQDAAGDGDLPGLLSDRQIAELAQRIHRNCQGASLLASGEAASNVDQYQINCSFYSALGGDELRYVMARAIQFFAPGVAQVYYAGLFALENDVSLLTKTGVGRDINRPYLTAEQVQAALHKPVVQALCQLIAFRNQHPAFNGDFSVVNSSHLLRLHWQLGTDSACLTIDCLAFTGHIHSQVNGENHGYNLADWHRPDWLTASLVIQSASGAVAVQ